MGKERRGGAGRVRGAEHDGCVVADKQSDIVASCQRLRHRAPVVSAHLPAHVAARRIHSHVHPLPIEASMRRLWSSIACVAVLVAVSQSASAQRGGRGGADAEGRGAGLPLTPSTPLKFTTDEVTWLELDLSPDGRTVVFDVLGDIYTVPVTGGKATRITSGQPFDAQPHYSPDGKQIVFISDRSQSNNVWIMNADGSNPRAVTRDANNTNFQSPTFTPDGKYVLVSQGNDMYMYYASGGASGFRLTGDTTAGRGRGAAPGGGRGAAAPNVFLGAAPSKDGRYIYFAMRNSTGGGYNQTALGWQIGVLDRETGRIFTKTNDVGSAMRPEISPDGRWLAYATRNNADESLMLRDLTTGDERLLLPKVQRDDQESRPNRDVFPTFSFTPDGRSIIIGHHGHLFRADVATGKETQIPFTADVDMTIGGPHHEQYALNDSVLTVHQIRDIAPSPDGKRLAFVALDRLWTMDLPNGTPRRVNPGTTSGEFQPAWSPDGQSIAYVSWNDNDGGAVMRVPASGGTPQKLSEKPAYYEMPVFSLDGRRVVVGRGPRNMRADLDELERPPQPAVGVELVWLPVERRQRDAHLADRELRQAALRRRRLDAHLLLRGRRPRVDALGRHRSEDDSAHRRRWRTRRWWRRRRGWRRRDDDVARRQQGARAESA